MMRRMFPEWAKILLPGFHPWNHDNSALVREYRRQADLPAGDLPPEFAPAR